MESSNLVKSHELICHFNRGYLVPLPKPFGNINHSETPEINNNSLKWGVQKWRQNSSRGAKGTDNFKIWGIKLMAPSSKKVVMWRFEMFVNNWFVPCPSIGPKWFWTSTNCLGPAQISFGPSKSVLTGPKMTFLSWILLFDPCPKKFVQVWNGFGFGPRGGKGRSYLSFMDAP